MQPSPPRLMVFVRCLRGRADVLFAHSCSEMENSLQQLSGIVSFVWKHEQLQDLVTDRADNFCILRRLTCFNGRVSVLRVSEELIISVVALGAARGINSKIVKE